MAEVDAAEIVEGVAVVVVGAVVTHEAVAVGFCSAVRQVLGVDAFLAGQEGQEEVYPLLFEDGLQFGQAAHAAVEDIGFLIVRDAVGVVVVEAAGVVFVYKPWLEEVIVFPYNNRTGVGGTVVGRPEILVVETDGGFAKAVVFFEVLVGGFLPFARQEGGWSELRFPGSDVDTFERLDLDEGGGSLQNGEQEETEGHEAEYLGRVAHGVRIGNR